MKLLERLKRGAAALATLLVPGGSNEPSLKWILDGRVEVPAAEREALQALFASAPPDEVNLGGHGTRNVQVEDGHVVAVALTGEVPLAALHSLAALRRLTLTRVGLTSLEGLGPWPQLAELRLDVTEIPSLKGLANCCPKLRDLSVRHAPFEDLASLAGAAGLERLALDHVALKDFSSAPRLPRLRELLVTSAPLQSLKGLDRWKALEELQLFGIKTLRDLESLPALPELRELRLHQNAISVLSDLPQLKALEMIETSDNKILSVQLSDLPTLQELEMHEEEMLSVELGALPALRRVDLRGEGYLFNESGRLRRLVSVRQPFLDFLDLARNHLVDLQGLEPQPTLQRIVLDRNPVEDLEYLAEGFPSLRSVSARQTRVAAIPGAFHKKGVVVDIDSADLKANTSDLKPTLG